MSSPTSISTTSPTSTPTFGQEKDEFNDFELVDEHLSTTPPSDDNYNNNSSNNNAATGASASDLERPSWEVDDDDQPHDNNNNNNNNSNNSNDDLTPSKKSGVFGASSNLVNSIVGAGIIGIPYAIKTSGLIAGVLLLIFVSFLTDKSLRVMIDAASFHPELHSRKVTTFEDLMAYPFGKYGSAFVLLNMFIMAYGAMVAYLLIIKDTVPTILGLAHGMKGGIEREIVLVITSLTIMVPLSMQKDMASLAFTSFLSVTADIILVFFVMIFSPIKESVQQIGGVGQLIKQDSIEPTLFIGLGILSTAMACQHSAFIVYGSIENGTRRRWARVTNNSIGLAAILCVILGVTGYIGFLDETQGDVLNNFEAGSVAANGARSLLAITMFFTYPMEAFVGRHVLISLFYKGDYSKVKSITLGLYVLTLIPALIFDDLGPVLSITGALGGSCISYIAPGFVVLGVNGEAFLKHCEEMLADYRRRKTNKSMTNHSDVVGDIELPVAGNSKRVMSDGSGGIHNNNDDDTELDLPVEGNKIFMTTSPSDPKPIWWYLLGYPLWCWIATKGSEGMKRKLSAPDIYDGTTDTNQTAENQALSSNMNMNDELADAVVVPTKGEFRMAIFFISFGILAAVAGLSSNIWVQINGFD